jgi:hypothetical protein
MGIRGELISAFRVYADTACSGGLLVNKGITMRLAAVVIAASMWSPGARAQEDREAILATVQQFFDALAESDVELGRKAVMSEGQYFRIRETGDSVGVSRTPHTRFLRNLEEGGNDFLERMWEPTVMQHGPMAIVWTPYDFHRGQEFSHCGVDVFNLIRTNEGWKIAGIMYTVEPTGCAPSPLGPLHRR